MLTLDAGGVMKLDIFERSLSGKWLGLTNYKNPRPPKVGAILVLWMGVEVKVKKCTLQRRHKGNEVAIYTVIVARLPR